MLLDWPSPTHLLLKSLLFIAGAVKTLMPHQLVNSISLEKSQKQTAPPTNQNPGAYHPSFTLNTLTHPSQAALLTLPVQHHPCQLVVPVTVGS